MSAGQRPDTDRLLTDRRVASLQENSRWLFLVSAVRCAVDRRTTITEEAVRRWINTPWMTGDEWHELVAELLWIPRADGGYDVDVLD